MNETPHVHQVQVHDYGSWWSIRYGDQPIALPDKPWRRFWESEPQHEARLAAALHKHVLKIVRAHDRQSLLAGMGMSTEQRAIPPLDPTKWGSDQLSYLTCDYDDEPAVDRVRWTVYGGAFKYRLVCERHRDRVRGQRGVDLVGLPGEARRIDAELKGNEAQ